MGYIRETYRLSVKRGDRVIYAETKPGTVTGAYNGYLRIRLDGEHHSRLFHPNWKLQLPATSDGEKTK